MAVGYTRNDTSNNIADGNVIDAEDFDGEFDAIQDAMHATTGHNHDGTTGGGGPITKVGPTLDVEATATELRPRVDNTVDLGTPTLEYKDLYVDGTAHIDTLDVDENATIIGTLDVTGAASVGDLSVSGTFTPTGSIDVTGVDTDTLIINTNVQSDIIPLADSAYDIGSVGAYWANGYIDAITTTGNVTVGGNIVVSGTVDGQDIAAMAAAITSLEAGGLDGASIKTLYEAEADTNAYTDAEKTKLLGIEAGADVTDTASVLTAGALMDAECANVTALKNVNQELTTTSAAQFGTVQTLTGAITSATSVSSNTNMDVGTSLSVGTNANVTGNITVGGTVDGYDIASMGSKLAGIESGADQTDASNVNAAGALMESDCVASGSYVKTLNQTLTVGSSPSFGNLSTNITGSISGGSVAATTLTASGDANFDNGTLFVDVSTNRVGIGTTSPSTSLEIVSNLNNALSFKGTSGDNSGGIGWYNAGGERTGRIAVSSDVNMTIEVDSDSVAVAPYLKLANQGSDIARVYSDSFRIGQFSTDPFDATSVASAGVWAQTNGKLAVGCNVTPLEVNRIDDTEGALINFRYDGSNGGNITTSGGTLGFTQVSDRNEKEDIKDAKRKDSVDAVKALSMKEFKFKKDPSKKVVKGFIAQDVQQVIPEAVSRVNSDDPDDPTLGINYLAMFPYVVDALNEALAKIEELETRIEVLEAAQ